jgi:hypothetical protein
MVANFEARFRDLLLKKLQERAVSSTRAECAVALDLLLGSHLPNQPVNADLRWIGGIKTRDVVESMLPRIRRSVGATAFQEIRERLIGAIIRHPLQNVADFREKVAKGNPAILNAPIISLYFGDRDFGMPEWTHDFGRTPMNELGA